MKNNNTIFWIVGLVLVGLLLFGTDLGLFATTGASMSRSVPSTVNPGQQFNVVYSTSASGTWGASIVDDVSGGCKFPDGSSQLKTVMLSSDGSSKTIKVTAPSSGSCTFSGDYKFGTEAIKNFPDKTITISTNGNGNGVNGDGDDVNGNGINGNGEVNGEIPSFDINKPLFKVGDFEVTALIILIGFGGLLVLSFLRK